MPVFLDCMRNYFPLLEQKIAAIPHHFPPSVFSTGIALKEVKKWMSLIPDELLPAQVRRSVLNRRVSFVAGRICAERALVHLGCFNGDVPQYQDGAPYWPSGVVGSITHTEDAAYAAASNFSVVRAIGIDTERIVDKESAESIQALCCSRSEINTFFGALVDVRVATLIFSAKEALYKAIYPYVRRYIDFLEVEVKEIDWKNGRIRLHLLASAKVSPNDHDFVVDFVEFQGAFHTSISLCAPFSLELLHVPISFCALNVALLAELTLSN